MRCLARLDLNYSETDFRKATRKEIIDLVQTHNAMLNQSNSNNEDVVEKHVNITDIPCL